MAEKTRLVGNSQVGGLQRDEQTKAITGFDIVNPNGSTLHVDLSLYAKTSQSPDSASANKLKEAVYKNYVFEAEHVPAMTAIFENNAKNFPNGIVWVSPQTPGLWADAPGKGAEYRDKAAIVKELSDKLHIDMTGKALMTGNLTLPIGRGPIEAAGGGTHEDALAQHYLGKDGKWHQQNSREALGHEHAHLVPELQNFSTLTQMQERNKDVPLENLKVQRRLENEAKAIEFVNDAMMKPAGIPERDPTKYQAVKPADVKVEARVDYTPEQIETLHHAPIPKSLSAYSQPKVEVVKVTNKLYGDNQDASSFERLMADAIDHVRNGVPASQHDAIFARLAERELRHNVSQRLKDNEPSLGAG